MNDEKEKTVFWKNWMTIAILLSFTVMVVLFNSQNPSIKSEPGANIPTGIDTNIPTGIDTNIPTGSGTNIPTGSGTNIPTGIDTNIQTSNDANLTDWIIVSFNVINENLLCISKAGYKGSYTDIERCGKFLRDNSNISLGHIDEYSNVSPSMKIVLDEYEKALKNYNVGGMKLEIGARSGNVSQMGDATRYIQNGNTHIKLIDKILYQDVISAKYVHSPKTGNETGNVIGENTT